MLLLLPIGPDWATDEKGNKINEFILLYLNKRIINVAKSEDAIHVSFPYSQNTKTKESDS